MLRQIFSHGWSGLPIYKEPSPLTYGISPSAPQCAGLHLSALADCRAMAVLISEISRGVYSRPNCTIIPHYSE